MAGSGLGKLSNLTQARRALSKRCEAALQSPRVYVRLWSNLRILAHWWRPTDTGT